VQQTTFRNAASLCLGIGALSIITLWSFNTLSALVDGPQAQIRHALAAVSLLVVARACLFHSSTHRFRSGRTQMHCRSNAREH